MVSHVALVPVGLPQGGMARVGDRLRYSGPPNWKFEPIDPDEREAWETNGRNDERVKATLERTPWTQREPADYPAEYDFILETK